MAPTRHNTSYSTCSRFEIDFQDGNHGGHLGFPVGMILAIFNLQVDPTLPIQFESIGLTVQEVEVENKFSRWQPCLVILCVLCFHSSPEPKGKST